MRFAERIRKSSEDLDRWKLAYEYLTERSQEHFEDSDISLIRDVLLPEGRPLAAGIGTVLMIIGTALLFVLPVMGIITIVGALTILFTVPAPAPESIRKWHVARSIAITLIIGFLAGGTWSPPVWWWTVAITLGSAFFVGFAVLWVNRGFPKIYSSFVHACSQLYDARMHNSYRRRAQRAKQKMDRTEKVLEREKSQCSTMIEHFKSVYTEAHNTGARFKAFASRRNGQAR